MISRLSTAGKTPPIKRATRGTPYGRLFIISRTIFTAFAHHLFMNSPANNDQSLCYAGYGAHLITIIARGHLVSAPVF